MFGDDSVDVEADCVLDLPPGDPAERQQEFSGGVAVAVLVLCAGPPRPEMREIERVALATGRADGITCRSGSTTATGQAVRPRRLVNAHRPHRWRRWT